MGEKFSRQSVFHPLVELLLTRGRGRPRHTSVLALRMVTLSARIIAATAARESLMNKSVTVLLLVILLGATASAKKDKSGQGADLLRQLEAQFAADVAQHGHDAFLTHFAEDGVELVDGGGINT